MDNRIITIRESLKEVLDPMRYEHTISVSYICISLAMRYGYDLDKAELAGLLHDCAKSYDEEMLIRLCNQQEIKLSQTQLKAPQVLHAVYGAWMAEHQYGIMDDDILNAVECHTTGKPAMGLLDQILFVADYIEPRRYHAANLELIRKMAFINLDQAVYEILMDTLDYLKRKGIFIDPMTQEAFQYYKRTQNDN